MLALLLNGHFIRLFPASPGKLGSVFLLYLAGTCWELAPFFKTMTLVSPDHSITCCPHPPLPKDRASAHFPGSFQAHVTLSRTRAGPVIFPAPGQAGSIPLPPPSPPPVVLLRSQQPVLPPEPVPVVQESPSLMLLSVLSPLSLPPSAPAAAPCRDRGCSSLSQRPGSNPCCLFLNRSPLVGV